MEGAEVTAADRSRPRWKNFASYNTNVPNSEEAFPKEAKQEEVEGREEESLEEAEGSSRVERKSGERR